MIRLSFGGYGISFGASWGPLEGSWGRLGGLLEAFWEALGVFWQSFGGLGWKIELEIVFRGFYFPKGPSWRHLGDLFGVFEGHFGFNFEAF